MQNSATEYINSYSWLGSRPGLERISELMRRLGNPQDKLKIIHLAGTNGKGSTASFLASVLQVAGYKTGLYTSPFIHTMHEEIRVNGTPISDSELERAVALVRPAAEAMDDHPTTFELKTAIAFCHFLNENCDAVVLETGMGGELDSTNVAAAPELCVITPIDMDHMEYLGRTIATIAKAKAGIIKPGRPVVTANQHPDALAVLENTAAEKNAELTRTDLTKLVPGSFSFEGQQFSFGELRDLTIGFLGRYQMENAATALTALQKLAKMGWNIPEHAIRTGLANARWPGRFELVKKEPAIIVDGGHNAQGALALADNLKRYFPCKKIIFVMGILADKDMEAILKPILPLAKQFFTITPDSPRAMDAADLAEYIAKQSIPATAMDSIAAAIDNAAQLAGLDGVVCYFGSLYSLSDVLNHITAPPTDC